MEREPKKHYLVVYWQPVEDPNPEALAKAFRMLFRRGAGRSSNRFDKNYERANVQEHS